MDKQLRDLIDMIHFTEDVSVKIHGLRDEAEIYGTVIEEFAKSKLYNATIFLLTEDGSKLRVVDTSTPHGKLKAAEKVAGLRTKGHVFELDKSRILSRVVRQGETFQAGIRELLDEFFPRPPAHLIAKVLRYEKTPFIATPLTRHGKIMGALAVSSTELAEHFIPSVRNLAQHISTALEMAEEHAIRGRLAEELHRQRDLLHKTFDSMTDAVFILDVQRHPTILGCNKAASTIFGYGKAEMLGRNTDFLHVSEKTLKEFKSMLYPLADAGRLPFHLPEFKMKRKDGSVFPSEHIVEQLLDDEGERIGWVSIVRDVTERKRAEKTLRKSEEKFRGLFENIFDGMFQTTPDGKILTANSALVRMLGYESIAELREINVRDLYLNPKDREYVTKKLEREGSIRNIELALKRKDGQKIIVLENARAVRDEQGRTKYYEGTLTEITELKKAQEALRESEERLRGIFSAMTDGVTLVGLDGIILDCNDAVLRLHDVSRDEYVGKNVYDFIAPEDRQRTVQEASSVLEKEILRSEVKALRKDGGFFDAEISVSLLRDASGKPNAFLGVTRDITERKRAIKELQESGEKFEKLFMSSPEPVVYLDVDDRILDVNPRFTKVFQFSLDEIKGKHINDVIVPEDRMEEARMLDREAKQEYFRLDTVRRRKDGTLVPVSISTAPVVVENRVEATIVVYKDITEQKEMERRLQESGAKFERLFMDNPGATVYVDPNLRILEVGPRFLELFGYSSHEIKGKHINDVIVPEDRMEEVRMLRKKALEGHAHLDTVRRRKDGTLISVSIFVAPVVVEGRLIGYVGVYIDITEHKQMEEELIKHTEHLEGLVEERTRELRNAERLAVIGETAAMVGHDLRNPLQSIVNTLYLVREKLKPMPSPDARKQGMEELLAKIEKQAEYMDKLVSDLQDYARPLKPELHKIGLQQLISDALSAIKVPENVKVSTVFDTVSLVTEKEFMVMVDPLLMRRLFTNLIINALQAMPDGGRLTITASKTEEAVLISVEDTGVGIPEEVIPKLFQPLFTIKPRGAGLGLAVCKRMVEAHGGTITIKSKVGRGTIITVKIPL